jgi:hypothetical protein
VPIKANADRRHHIPKQKRKVTYWAAYDASLRQRGSLTVWFSDEAIVAWRAAPRTTRGAQPWYADYFREASRLVLGSVARFCGSLSLDRGPLNRCGLEQRTP